MEKLSLGLFTGAFEPGDSKRYSFKARGAQTAVALAQLVYNGVSTILFKSSEGYAEIADNYMSWTFHAPKGFMILKGSSTALNCQYIQDQGEKLTLGEFFTLLANASDYESGVGVEVAGWESAMRTLQLGEDKINDTISGLGTAYLYNPQGDYASVIEEFGSFSAPSGTENLFAQFVRWLSSRIQRLWDRNKIKPAKGENPLDLPASFFLDNGGESGEPEYFCLNLEFVYGGSRTARMSFKFADYEE